MKSNKLSTILQKFNIIYGIILAALFIAIALFITVSKGRHKARIAQNISNIVEEKLKNNDRRDALKILSSSQASDFKSISYYNSDGKRVLAIPPNWDPPYLGWIKEFKITLYFDREKRISSGVLIFSVNRLESIPEIILIGLFFIIILIPILIHHKKLIIKNFEQEANKAKADAVMEIARQVGHDSRGAIQAIRAVTDSSHKLGQLQMDALKSATRRLESMINDEKISKAQDNTELQMALCHIYTSIEEIIREKEILYKTKILFNYDFDALKVFLPVNETDIKRILSNICDNSFDATSEKAQNPHVSIKLSLQERCLIEVYDNGIGIKPELLSKVGQKGYSSKKNGAGRGISWAIQKINEAGGELKIKSKYKEWTKVTIILPLNKKSFLGENTLDLTKINSVVAIDDDPSLLKIWEDKISPHARFIGHNSGESYFKSPISEATLFLVDYDLGEDQLNGLEIIARLKGNRIYLVSNNFDDREIQEACFKKNIKIIPKTIIRSLKLSPP